MKNPTAKVLDQAWELRAKGRNHKEIMAETGLSHSQMERHFMAVDLLAGVIPGGLWPQPESNTAKRAQITKARLAGESWGLISVRYQEPESRTRKAFEEASGLRSKGMRTGKGGAPVQKNMALYTGADRGKLGTELLPTAPISEQVPTDLNAVPVRTLPKLVKLPPKGRAASRSKK